MLKFAVATDYFSRLSRTGGRRHHAGGADDFGRYFYAGRTGGRFRACSARFGVGVRWRGRRLGRLLVDTLGWRSIFFVNLPFGALGFIVLVWQYHDHEKPHSTDLDLPGVLALAVACTALLPVGIHGLITAAAVDAGLLVLAIAAIVWFIRVERRAKNPIMPPELVMERRNRSGAVVSALMGIAFFGVDTYVPLFVQGTTGAGAKAAAGVVTPVMLAWAASGIVRGADHHPLGISPHGHGRQLLHDDQFLQPGRLCACCTPAVGFWPRC